MTPQTTLRAPATLEGHGIHSGETCRIVLNPAPAGSGIRFRRTDLKGAPDIPAQPESLGPMTMLRQTVLQHPDAPEVSVKTVEHVLAALGGLGVDNALVEMSAAEAPIWDGSALTVAQAIEKAGVEPLEGTKRPYLRIAEPMAYFPEGADGVEYTAWPSERLTLTYFLQYDHPAIGSQAVDITVRPGDFLRDLAGARTFCMIEEVEYLRSQGLIKGGNIDNAVVYGPEGPLNTELHWDNEPARHKALDLLGDLMLLGAPVQGHILASKGGHQTNAQFVRHLRKELSPS